MAVESRHLNQFPQQLLTNREMMINAFQGHGNVFGAPNMVAPLSGTTNATETIFPMYASAITGCTKNEAMKSDSALTYAVPVSRKRSRDMTNPLLLSSFSGLAQNQTAHNRSGSFTFLGDDISHQIQQQQMEIDRFVAQHTEKVISEIEDRRRRYSRRIIAAVEENIMKKLKSKEDEIEKIGKLNWTLEERVKSLFVENQIWRNLAQTNEATANALRSNLEQVLAQANDDQQNRHYAGDTAALIDDAQSCCGSNFDELDQCTLVDCASNANNGRNSTSNSMCKSCGKDESCVLLLPCRHLCLCTVCGSGLQICPVCHSTKTASVHVNLS